MLSLRVALLALISCAALILGQAKVLGAAPKPPGNVVPQPPEEAGALSEVDAFLGAYRSTRIATIIPDHARACLPSGRFSAGTEAQRAIAEVARAVAKSPLGAWLLEQAAARLVLICHDPTTELAAYYRAPVRLIGLYERLAEPARIMFLAHELAHVPQHPRYSNDLRFGPEAVLVLHRLREATAEAVATRVLWQMQARGHPEPWQYKLGTAYGDIARAFEQAIDGEGDLAELRATRAAFDQWFGRPGRVHSYDARILGHIARVRLLRPGPTRPSRALTEDFVRGIAWYAGANFLPPEEGRVLGNPRYTGGLSMGNAAELQALLQSAM